MDFNWLTHTLAIGGTLRPGGIEFLKSLGVQAVIDLRSEALDDKSTFRMNGIKHLHLPTPDLCAVSQPMLWRGVNFTRQFILVGEKVLIHCQHGIGRSSLTCLLYSCKPRTYPTFSSTINQKCSRESVSHSRAITRFTPMVPSLV